MDQRDYAELDQYAAVLIGPEYRSYRVPGDGSCQFSSLYAALHAAVRAGAVGAHVLDGLNARTLRERVVDWLQTHGDTQLEDERPGTFCTRHNGMRNAICWDEYLAKMRTDQPDEFGRVEWGDETTLMAFSCLFNLTVQVVCLDSTQIMMIIPRPTPWQTASSPSVSPSS